MALTPLPVTPLPAQYSIVGSPFEWTAGDAAHNNEFPSSGRDIVVVQNADGPSAGYFAVALGAPSAGNFTLTYGAQTTANIPYIALRAAIQSALNALPSKPLGGFTVVGDAPAFIVQGPSGIALTALTADFSGLTDGAGTVATGPAGGAGTAHGHTIKSAEDTPFGRTGDITETIAAGAFRVYQMFPSGGWAVGGVIEIDPTNALLKYVVLRVP